jgi:hypothetical protein
LVFFSHSTTFYLCQKKNAILVEWKRGRNINKTYFSYKSLIKHLVYTWHEFLFFIFLFFFSTFLLSTCLVFSTIYFHTAHKLIFTGKLRFSSIFPFFSIIFLHINTQWDLYFRKSSSMWTVDIDRVQAECCRLWWCHKMYNFRRRNEMKKCLYVNLRKRMGLSAITNFEVLRVFQKDENV